MSWETLSIAGMDTPVKLPHVSWYAAGGLVNGAQLIGVGERGTELVWPSYGNALNKYADAIASRMKYDANNEDVIIWLANNLGPIINEYTPRTGKRDLVRMVGTYA